MTPAIELALLIFAAAALYGSVGHAGASGYLAAMALVGLQQDVMKPTALALNILAASIVSVRFWRAGYFDWRTFWPFALGSIPLAFFGGGLKLPGGLYKQIVGALLILAALRMIQTASRARDQADSRATPPPILVAIMIGAVIGVVSGLTGTGGGIFLTPTLLLMGWARIRTASGVSAPFILVNSIAGLSGNVLSVRSLPPHLWLWALSAALGAALGSELGSRRFAPRTLRYLLSLVLIIAGCKLLLLR
jgi:uncharacterized membrane protein YfcA